MPEIVYRHSFPFREAMAALLGDDQIDADSYEIRVIGSAVVVDLVNPKQTEPIAKVEDTGEAPVSTETKLVEDLASMRFWHHPESCSVWRSADNEEGIGDGMTVEVDEETFLRLEAEYAAAATEPTQPPKGGARAKKAGMLCAEKGFQTFMDVATADEAAAEVRSACGITSRAMLDHDDAAGKKFDEINRRYGLWTQGYDV